MEILCAMSDNLETSDYEDCLNENRDNRKIRTYFYYDLNQITLN